MTREFTEVLEGLKTKLKSWQARCFSIISPISDIVFCSITLIGHRRAPGNWRIFSKGIMIAYPLVTSVLTRSSKIFGCFAIPLWFPNVIAVSRSIWCIWNDDCSSGNFTPRVKMALRRDQSGCLRNKRFRILWHLNSDPYCVIDPWSFLRAVSRHKLELDRIFQFWFAALVDTLNANCDLFGVGGIIRDSCLAWLRMSVGQSSVLVTYVNRNKDQWWWRKV